MSRRRKQTPSRARRVIRYAGWGVAGLVVLSIALTLPLRFAEPVTTAFILADDSGRIPVAWQWRDFDEVAPAMPLAVVAAEDQKFTQHAGFDLESIRKSVAEHERGGRLRGASTISQQVAKNLYLWSGRNFLRKGLEAWLTAFLELGLPKRRILELHLNIAEYGPGIFGVEAASRHFFGKPATALSRREAALLAAVLPDPVRFDAGRPTAYLRERQRWILGQMARLEREGFFGTLD